MVYVTPSVTRLFLSRETCSDLGLISPQFPSTTTAAAASSIPLPGQPRFGSPHSTPSPPSRNDKARGPSLEQINTAPQARKRTCGCLTRSLPPTGPIPLPVPATEENRSALEQHLRSTFKASTFNVCTHQPLPMMIGPGFPPQQAKMPNPIRQFYIHRLHLYTMDGVVIFRDRVVIPPALRDDCLQFLHSAHQGTTMMQAKADASIFWPGIAADISYHRSSCTPCNVMSPSQASLPPTLPTRPFQSLCVHHKGHT